MLRANPDSRGYPLPMRALTPPPATTKIVFMDDVLRRLREQEEMMRRLTDGPLKSYLEIEESVRRLVDAASGIDIAALEGKQLHLLCT